MDRKHLFRNMWGFYNSFYSKYPVRAPANISDVLNLMSSKLRVKTNSVVDSSDQRTATSSTELSWRISISVSPTCLSWCSCAAASSGSLRTLGGLHPWPPPRFHSLWGQTLGLNLKGSLYRLHISHGSWLFNDFYVTVKLIVFKVFIVVSGRNSTRKREWKQI